MSINAKTKKCDLKEQYECIYVNNRKTGIKLLPYVVSSVMLLQVPLQILLSSNIHIYITILALFFLLTEYALGGFRVRCWRVFTLVFFVFSWIPLSSFMLPSILIPAIGAIDYLLPILFWSLYFSRFRDYFSITTFCRFLIIFGVLMASLGIYQIFFDPSLFGIMSNINPYYNRSTLEHVSVFRISSFFSSTQTYSLYIGMCIALVMELWNRLNLGSLLKWFSFIILLIGGLFAGGKVFILFFVLSFLFLSMKIIKRKNFKVKNNTLISTIYAIILLFMVFVLLHKYIFDIMSGIVPAANRMFAFFSAQDIFLKQESVRIKAMLKIFSSDWENIFWGHGLGTASYSAYNTVGHKFFFTRFTSESYAISWWYEMGIFGFIAFIVFFGGIVLCAFKKRTMTRITILCLVMSMFFVPTFYSINMLPAWGILLFPYYNKRRIYLKGELQ